jgi:hypothetical protein
MDYVKYAVNYNKLNLQMGGIQEVKDIRRHERKSYSKPIYFAHFGYSIKKEED